MMRRPCCREDARVADRRVPTYAVVWQKGDGPVVPGQLRLDDVGILLFGSLAGRAVEHVLPYRSLAVVRLGHQPDERLTGCPSLLVELQTLERFLIAAIGGFGVLTELAEQITAAMALA